MVPIFSAISETDNSETVQVALTGLEKILYVGEKLVKTESDQRNPFCKEVCSCGNK